MLCSLSGLVHLFLPIPSAAGWIFSWSLSISSPLSLDLSLGLTLSLGLFELLESNKITFLDQEPNGPFLLEVSQLAPVVDPREGLESARIP